MQGIYFLLLQLENKTDIQVGALGEITFEPGFYVYVGSAQNGVEGRVSRHLRDDKTIHWHIDHLAKKAEIDKALVVKGGKEEECRAAKNMSEDMVEVEGFGCSDCGCDSHLFYWGDGKIAEANVVQYLEKYPKSQLLKLEQLEE